MERLQRSRDVSVKLNERGDAHPNRGPLKVQARKRRGGGGGNFHYTPAESSVCARERGREREEEGGRSTPGKWCALHNAPMHKRCSYIVTWDAQQGIRGERLAHTAAAHTRRPGSTARDYISSNRLESKLISLYIDTRTHILFKL